MKTSLTWGKIVGAVWVKDDELWDYLEKQIFIENNWTDLHSDSQCVECTVTHVGWWTNVSGTQKETKTSLMLLNAKERNVRGHLINIFHTGNVATEGS